MSGSQIVRIGLIGSGPFVPLARAAWERVPDAELVGMADITRYRDLIEKTSLDGVEILIDPAAHRDVVEFAAAQGKHVALHKPLALSLESAQAIAAAVKKSRIRAVVFDPLLFHPFVARAAELLADDQIGEIQMLRIKSHAGGQGGFGPGLDPDRLNNPNHAMLLEWPFDKAALIERLMGPVVEVFCYGGPNTRIASFKFRADGRYGVHEAVYSPGLLVQSEAAATDDTLEITGTDGILWLRNLTATMVEAPKLMLKRKEVVTVWDDRVEYDQPHIQAGMREHFAAVIRGRAEPLHSLEEAQRALRLNLAAEEAIGQAQAKSV